jgi:AraC-like DNA-binding protein
MSNLIRYVPKGSLKELADAIVYLDGLGTGIALQRVYQVIIINIGSNFHVSDPYVSTPAREHQSIVWINGKHETPYAIQNFGTARMFVIGIKPGMLPYFIRIPVTETNNQALDAEEWSTGGITELRTALLSCKEIQEAFLMIEDFFTTQLQGKDFSQLPKINYLAGAMRTSTVQQICQTLNYSRKRLRTEALHFFGAPVKNMQGIIRFDQHLATIAGNPHQSLSSLHHFFDQAHFIKDFKERTGMTPSQYRRLCQQYGEIKYTPNFIPLQKETFLQFLRVHTS